MYFVYRVLKKFVLVLLHEIGSWTKHQSETSLYTLFIYSEPRPLPRLRPAHCSAVQVFSGRVRVLSSLYLPGGVLLSLQDKLQSLQSRLFS